MVYGGGLQSISRQNLRFSAFSPGNLRFENPVKYKIGARVNQKMQPVIEGRFSSRHIPFPS
jgi:hypothetical protein